MGDITDKKSPLSPQRGYCYRLRLSIMLSCPKPTKFGVCVTIIGCATAKKFSAPPGSLGRDKMVKYKSQFQRFLYQTLCVCFYRISVLTPGSCPRGWTWGGGGGGGGAGVINLIFANMVMWHIKLTGMMKSKGQISLNFNYKVNFKDFYTKLFVCSHK